MLQQHDIELVTDVVDNAYQKTRIITYSVNTQDKKRIQHLCLTKRKFAQEQQELIKRGYVLHISCNKRKEKRIIKKKK